MRKSIFITLLAVTGCATVTGHAPNTGIVKIADNTFMYAKQDWMAHSGGVVKAELYKEANAFCESKGKKLTPINSTSVDHRIGSSASAEIQFSCD